MQNKKEQLERIKSHFERHSTLAPSQIKWLLDEVDSLNYYTEELERIVNKRKGNGEWEKERENHS